jgi:hypothetical protein
VAGGIAYVADYSRGVYVVDVRNASSPTPIAGIPALYGVVAVTATDELLYTVALHEGIQIRPAQCLLPTEVPEAASTEAVLASASPLSITPNPSGGVFHISLGREVAGKTPTSGASEVHIEIFDVRGRRVRELTAAAGPSGLLEVSWDGRDKEGSASPTGVYLVRATWVGGSAAGRLLLIR